MVILLLIQLGIESRFIPKVVTLPCHVHTQTRVKDLGREIIMSMNREHRICHRFPRVLFRSVETAVSIDRVK